jgi:hypothetical protein
MTVELVSTVVEILPTETVLPLADTLTFVLAIVVLLFVGAGQPVPKIAASGNINIEKFLNLFFIF